MSKLDIDIDNYPFASNGKMYTSIAEWEKDTDKDRTKGIKCIHGKDKTIYIKMIKPKLKDK